jgi:hypothetical protein
MKEQRYLPALRAHIDQLLREGWVIAQRNPLKLQFQGRTCLVTHGMLISEGPLWNHADTERPPPPATRSKPARRPCRSWLRPLVDGDDLPGVS